MDTGTLAGAIVAGIELSSATESSLDSCKSDRGPHSCAELSITLNMRLAKGCEDAATLVPCVEHLSIQRA